MSDKGICAPVFREGGYAVNQEIYLNEYIRKILSSNSVYFWPDIVISHCNTIADYIDDENVNFVNKEDNPVVHKIDILVIHIVSNCIAIM